MRLAVLVLASQAPRALAAIARYFEPSDADLYVHVDAKTALADYLHYAGPLPPRVGFFEPPHRVYWAGFSMIEATLDLLRVAIREGPYERYLFISDNSLPVQSLDGLFAGLAQREDLIVCRRPPSGHPVLARYDQFHLMDGESFDSRRNWASPPPLGKNEFDQIERVLALKRRGKRPFVMYHGQASWALSHDSVRRALDAVDHDPWLRESFRFSAHTDEFFFQSLVGAAKYPQGLDDGPTYSDSCRLAPRVIRTARDLPLDMHANFLFLRKIAPDFDEALPETCLRLYAGLRQMLAKDLAVRHERLIGLAEGDARHLHLMAPIEDDPSWGGVENLWGRRYRRLRGESVVWRLRAPAAWPAVRLSLPCVIGAALPPDAVFEIDGRRVALEETTIGFGAQFRDLAQPFETITLHAPASGLAVAVLPQA